MKSARSAFARRRQARRRSRPLKALRGKGKTKASIRSPELARRIKEEPADSDALPCRAGGARSARVSLTSSIASSRRTRTASAAPATNPISIRSCAAANPRTITSIREFGAIGNGVSFAIGVAAARKDGKTVLFEGDGSLLMHIQELEVVQRHGIKVLMSS